MQSHCRPDYSVSLSIVNLAKNSTIPEISNFFSRGLLFWRTLYVCLASTSRNLLHVCIRRLASHSCLSLDTRILPVRGHTGHALLAWIICRVGLMPSRIAYVFMQTGFIKIGLIISQSPHTDRPMFRPMEERRTYCAVH